MQMSLKTKLIVLVLFPHLAIIGLAGEAIYQQLDSKEKLRALVPLQDIATTASGIIHELQSERGRTVGVISSGFAADRRGELTTQREKTNAEMRNFRAHVAKADMAALPKRVVEKLAYVEQDLKQLDAHRALVDGRKVSVEESLEYYSTINSHLIDVIAVASEYSPAQEVTVLLLPYLYLVHTMESASLERAHGASLLNDAEAGVYDAARYRAYRDQLRGEEVFLEEYHRFASKQEQKILDDALAQPEVARVEELREILASLEDTRDTHGLTAANWYEAATQWLATMRSIEDRTAEAIHTRTEELMGAADAAIFWLVATNVMVIIVFASIGLAGALPLSRRVGVFVDNLRAIAGGNRDIDLVDDQSQDDIGAMNRALVQFRDSIIAGEKEQEERARQEAIAAEEKVKALKALADAVEGELQTTVVTISENGESLAARAQDLKRIGEEVSENQKEAVDAAEQASANAEAVSRLLEEVNSSLESVVAQVSETRSAADRAATTATGTGQVVGKLQEAATEVGAVVNLISEIAEQTNLLALNATIEAARAGDAGKGFAVVANEVKSLATQTQRSVSEITSQVALMQGTTEEAVGAMSQIHEVIEQINAAAAQIDEAVQTQRASAAEIASNAEQSTDGARRVTDRVGGISESLSRVDEVAVNVAEASSVLKNDIDGLESTIRRIVRTSTPEVDNRKDQRRKESKPVAEDRRSGGERRQVG